MCDCEVDQPIQKGQPEPRAGPVLGVSVLCSKRECGWEFQGVNRYKPWATRTTVDGGTLVLKTPCLVKDSKGILLSLWEHYIEAGFVRVFFFAEKQPQKMAVTWATAGELPSSSASQRQGSVTVAGLTGSAAGERSKTEKLENT